MARDFQQRPVRVVIVDDHRLFVDALALLLGHDERLEVIGTASDGPTAIDLAVDGGAEVAVIDVRMPEVDGIETAKRLRKRSPETRENSRRLLVTRVAPKLRACPAICRS